MSSGGVINNAFEGNENSEQQKNENGIKIVKSSSGDTTSNNQQNLESGNEVPVRPTWGNGLEFLMSCISLSVGLGNVWRFPFTAYENGGGAFLIPYIIVLILIGKPMYYMEMAIGQFTSKASVKMYNCVPALKGVGIGQMIGSISILSYYCSLIALTLYYTFKSFAAELPWSKCMNSWKKICIPSSVTGSDGNVTSGATSSSELYFIKEVIKEKDHINDGIGVPDWELTLWLLFAWVCVYLVIVKGIKSSGKVSYVLAIFPYVVMLTLLIHTCTLEGSGNGILYFIRPDFKRILEAKVWKEAVVQCFFSLSTATGPIVMFASYNAFTHNIYRDAMIVTTLDTFTSILGGCTIFGVLGNLAYKLGESDVSKVFKGGGSALAFISYPDAISKFQTAPQFFSVIFFLMLFILGVGSAVGLQSSNITNIMDHVYGKQIKYWHVAGGCCVFGFLSGLVYVTPGGQWMLTLVDDYGGTLLIFVLAIFELIAIFWIYGLENFCWDLEYMSGRRVSPYWRISWGIITPLFMIVIFFYSMANYQDPGYATHKFPPEYIAAGWTIFAIGMLQILVWGAWIVGLEFADDFKSPNTLDRFKKSFYPNQEWGPKDPTHHENWLKYKKASKEKRDLTMLNEEHTWLTHKVYILLGKYDN